MPDLSQLCAALGENLRPCTDAPVPAVDVTGVHVSELTDPTPFLEGGELLLTTGMPFTAGGVRARAYAARLTHRGVAALGMGLGPIHERLPPGLEAACAAEGLPLLVVPPATGFLVIARTYWGLLARSGEERMNAALGAHRALVRAAAGPDGHRAVVRTLAGAVEGWAALLSRTGQVEAVWPEQSRSTAEQAAGEVTRLRVAGPHSSATFPLGQDDVVLHPLATRGRLTGFVATGCRRPMNRADRQTILTASALLALQSEQQHQRDAGPRSLRGAAARLLLAGEPAAALLLLDDLGIRTIGPAARLVAVDTGRRLSADDLAEGLERAIGTHADPLVLPRGSGAVGIVGAAAGRPDLAGLRSWLAEVAPQGHALLSAPAALAQLPRVDAALAGALGRLPAGAVRSVEEESVGEDPPAMDLAPLLDYRRSDLTPAVIAYLRARGHWEEAARALGIHRNTLRHRIGTAAKVLHADLDDPDVAAHLWLALRRAGLA